MIDIHKTAAEFTIGLDADGRFESRNWRAVGRHEARPCSSMTGVSERWLCEANPIRDGDE